MRSRLRDPLTFLCIAAALLALLLPGDWLTGGAGPDDPRNLDLGATLWRITLLLAAVFLLVSGGKSIPARPAAPRASIALPLAGIIAAAAALRVYRMGAPLWYDEIWMLLDSVRPPVADLLRTFGSDNNHPLYSLLASLSVRTFGESAWALRLPAVLFGVGSVWMLGVFARDRIGPATALLGAALLTVSTHHVWFSQNARGYTGLLFFTLLSSHLLLLTLEQGRRRHFIGYGVALALCVQVHMTGVFIAAGQLAVLITAAISRRNPDGVKRGFLGLAFGGLLSLHLYSLILPQVVSFFTNRPPAPGGPARWTNPLWMIEETALSFGLGLWPGLAVLVVGAAVAVLGIARTVRRASAVPTLLLVPGILAAILLLALGRNLWPRFFFFLGGFGVLVAVEGVRAIARRRRIEIVLLALVVLAAASLLPRAYRLPKQDYPAARAYVDGVRAPGEAVGTAGLANQPYERYYRAGYIPLEELADFEELFPQGASGYVIYTFPVYLESRLPELWARIRERGSEVARFDGSIGGGDVVVLRVEGSQRPGR